ncbi:MAG: hypothetical protein IKE18_05435 [Oscillospiraceae bacterium]|nr:hypothetical protein [Oscillospiraceae bacterium]
MFSIRLNIEKIDYEQTVGALLPSLIGTVSKDPSLKELSKLFTKLGSDAVPVTKKMLQYLRADIKDQIIDWLLSGHKLELCSKVNGYLEKLFGKNTFVIGDLYAENLPGSRIDLIASGIAIDYSALLSSPMITDAIEKMSDNALVKGGIKLAMQMGSKMSPENLEKQILPILASDKIKEKILSALSGGLTQAGLYVTVKNISFETVPGTAPAKKTASGIKQGLIPDSFEDGVIEGIALWLKSTVS